MLFTTHQSLLLKPLATATAIILAARVADAVGVWAIAKPKKQPKTIRLVNRFIRGLTQ